MTQTADKLSPFLATSAVLHVSLFVLVVFGPALFSNRAGTSWGSSIDKPVTVGVATSLPPGIPLPAPAVVQETAKPSDSKTLHPAEVAPKPPTKVPSKPADVKIPARGATEQTKSAPEPQTSKGATPPPPAPTSNAIPGDGGQIALPYGAPAGAGKATFGDGTFGTRFGSFVTALITAMESAWQQPPTAASQRVYVTFTIRRNGRSAVATDVELDQSSGNGSLDRSAVRAVQNASLPPLPPDFSGSSVAVRFYFETKR
jgi:TonB family protein